MTKDRDKVDAAWRQLQDCGVSTGQTWWHTHTHSSYEIVCLSLDEVRIVPLVTYRSRSLGYVWTRDLEAFLGKNEEGSSRFTRSP
jgi:hypothetical protein